MILEYQQMPEWIQLWYHTRKHELMEGSDALAKLNEATERLQEHLATEEARRALNKFDNAYGDLLCQEEFAAFSLGFELGRRPAETLLGPLWEVRECTL